MLCSVVEAGAAEDEIALAAHHRFAMLDARDGASDSGGATAMNEPAVRLYDKLGFRRDLSFFTFVKDTRR